MAHYGPSGGDRNRDRGDRYGDDRGGDRGGGGGYGGGSGGGDRMGQLGANLDRIQWDLGRLAPFEKNFYIEHPEVSKRSSREADEWRREVGITVVGRGIPKVEFHVFFIFLSEILLQPIRTFEEASMPEYLLKEVLKQGFSARMIPSFFILALISFFSATPIQSQGWPMALLGRDMIGISATGSGKTLAFLLPGMIHINAQVSPC
jgi:ATP-dependent RNA helicase DDX5/DBP2